MQAGVQYPSDVRAGLALGRAVASLVISRARADGSDATWMGTVPTGPGNWRGPALASAEPTWRDERAPRSDGLALGWPYGFHGRPSVHAYWNRQVSRMVFEDKLDDNPPRAARAYALVMVTVHDAWIAAQDAKLRYSAPRPNQLEPALAGLVPTPHSPSHPADHVSITFAAARALGYLFARDATAWQATADEVAESAIRAGVQLRSDIEVARAIGLGVADAVIARARYDGPEGPAR